MKIIAEVGINANGSLETALQLMDMAKRCGADFVKFQKREIDLVYSREFLESPRESPWGKTQGDQKRGLEFPYSAYEFIDEHSRRIELPWFGSAWDVLSLEFLESFNPHLHKVASPMITNLEFMRSMARMKRMTLISTGMSGWESIFQAVDIFRAAECPFALLHCTSEYPCPDDGLNLAMIPRLAKEFPGVEIGYSNHSPGILGCIGAAFMGAQWIEVHVTLDRSAYGSDQAASIEEPGLRRIVEYCKLAPTLIGDGVKIIRTAERINGRKLRYWEVKDGLDKIRR